MTRSTTTQSSPCQAPPSTQTFWSPMYVPQLPSQSAPMQCYPWSLPTSPYLQSSIQAWSAHLPLPSSAASDLSQTEPPRKYVYSKRRDESVEVNTPAHTSSSASANMQSQEAKKAKFFTLPSILCTLRRWHARRKERKNKKVSGDVPIDKRSAEEMEVESESSLPLGVSASLPGAYLRGGYPRAPSSDQGLGGTPQCYLGYHGNHQLASQTEHSGYHPMPQMCIGDPSPFMSQMQQSLSTYRT